MWKAAAVGWIAAAVMIGLIVSRAVAQENASPISSAALANAPLAVPPSAKRADAIVPPVRRVRPKTPPGPVSVRRSRRPAPSKGSAAVRRAAVSKVAAGPGCEQTLSDRKLRRCEPKNGAKAARHQKGAALPRGSQTR
jgi:hypothetical protein